MGSPLKHNKYAEGYPGKRYYGGCECVDEVERLAIERAKELFGCEYVNVQPHSGALGKHGSVLCNAEAGRYRNGNEPCTWRTSFTRKSGKLLSGAYFKIVPYGVNDEGVIDYEEVRKIALEAKPKMIVAGASAYCRVIDFKEIS